MLFMVTNRRIVDGKYSDEEMRGHKYEYQYKHLNVSKGEDGFAEKGKAGFEAALLAELKQLSDSGIRTPKIGLYLHGYNNHYQDSIDELVDLKKSLADVMEHPPILVGFSWPSSGLLPYYLSDREEARDSVGAFTKFLVEINEFVLKNQRNCFSSAFCIAHSMGCYLLRKGLEYLSDDLGRPTGRLLFDEAILLAPDLSSRDIEKDGKGQYIGHFARRVHVYYSKHDGALKKSSWKRFGSNRLGRHGAEDYDNLDRNIVVVDAKKYANSNSIADEDLTDRKGEQVTVHSSHRYHPKILADVDQVIRSIDRDEISGRQIVQRECAPIQNHYELV